MRWYFWRRKRREIDLDDEIAYDLALDARSAFALASRAKKPNGPAIAILGMCCY